MVLDESCGIWLDNIVLKSVWVREILVLDFVVSLIYFLILVYGWLLAWFILNVACLRMVYLILRNLGIGSSLLTEKILVILKRCRYFLLFKFIIIILLIFNLSLGKRSVYLTWLILNKLIILFNQSLRIISFVEIIIVIIFKIIFGDYFELARWKLSLLRLVHFFKYIIIIINIIIIQI